MTGGPDPSLERRDHDRRFLDELVRAHDKVHASEAEVAKAADEGHWRQHDSEHKAVRSWESAHLTQHISEQKAVDVAIESEQRRLGAHREAHEAAHAAHQELHDASDAAHVAMHDAEHRAVLAATASMDKRLDSMNAFRDQLREQTARFVQVDAFEAFKDERRVATSQADAAMDKRYEELRSLIATEREERRDMSGQRKGATASLGWIIAAVGAIGTILGILVAVAALLSSPAVVVP